MAKRYLISIGLPTAPNNELLPKVERDVKLVTKFLTDETQQYDRVLEREIGIGASASEIRERLSDWYAATDFDEEDQVIIYIAAHGDAEGGRFREPCILTSNTDHRNPMTWISAKELVRIMFDGKNTRPSSTLLILDICYAGRSAGKGIAEFASHATNSLEKSAGFWVVASSSADTQAIDGLFIKALFGILNNDAWQPAGEYYSITWLIEEINKWFEEKLASQRATLYVAGATRRDRFIKTIKRFNKINDFAHWNVKAKGVELSSEQLWLFTGRTEALTRVVQWICDPNASKSVLVVTGDPGSGKSALLGRLVLSSQPASRQELLKGLNLVESDSTVPPINSISLFVNARGADLDSLIKVFSEQLNCDNTIDALLNTLRNSEKIIGIVIDSIDEANDVHGIVSNLLIRMAPLRSIRLLIGSRRKILIPSFVQEAESIDLDDDRYFSFKELFKYALKVTSASLDRVVDQHWEPIIHEIALQAGHSFLYVRIVCRFLKTISEDQPPQDIKLPATVLEAFHEEFARFDPAFRTLVLELLTPLAYSMGRGLPQKNVWHLLASQISGRIYTNSEIRTIKERVGYYLVEDAENGETVYRLFHNKLAEYLKEITKDEDVACRFTEGLLLLRGKHPQTGKLSWQHTHERYLLSYFAAHLASVGKLEEYFLDLDFLTYYPKDRLVTLLQTEKNTQADPKFLAYKASAHWISTSLTSFKCHLWWKAYTYGAKDLLEVFDKSELSLPWKPNWAKEESTIAGYVLAHFPANVVEIACFMDHEFGPVVLAGYYSGQVTVNSLSDGSQLCLLTCPFTEDSRPIHILVERIDSKLIALIGWSNRIIATFELPSGRLLAASQFPRITSMTLVSSTGGGHVVLATSEYVELDEGSNFEEIKFIKLSLFAHELEQEVSCPSRAPIYCMKELTYQGRSLIISGGDSVSGGENRESMIVKVWSTDNLSQIWQNPSIEESILGKVFPVFLNRKLWILAHGNFSGRIVLFCVDSPKRLRIQDDAHRLSKVINVSCEDTTIYVLGTENDFLKKVEIDMGKEIPVVRSYLIKLAYPISKALWCGTIPIHGTNSILSVENRFLKVWRLDELLSKEHEDNNYFMDLATAESSILTTTALQLLNVDLSGEIINRVNIPPGASYIRYCAEERMLVLQVANRIYMVDPESLKLNELFELPEDVRQVKSFDVYYDEGFVYAICAVNYSNASNYRCHVINLSKSMEINLPNSLAISAYEDKSLNFAIYCFSPSGSYYAIGGPYGQIMIHNAKTGDVLYKKSWSMSNLNYVTKAAASKLAPIIMIGNESGDLAVQNLDTNHTIACIRNAHDGSIEDLCLHRVGDQELAVTVSTDNVLKFWSIQLEMIYSIQLDHEIIRIEFLDERTLVLLGRRTGLTSLDLDWSKILQGS